MATRNHTARLTAWVREEIEKNSKMRMRMLIDLNALNNESAKICFNIIPHMMRGISHTSIAITTTMQASKEKKIQANQPRQRLQPFNRKLYSQVKRCVMYNSFCVHF